MSDLRIVNFPHPALRWKSKDVNRIDAQLKNWIAQMFDLMYAARGIGLAANQVGLPYRLFVINPSADPAEKELEQVFINPQIIKRNGSEDAEEGCLSLPEIYGPVTRAERITVEAFDLTGENFAYELGGIHARVVQHESDHLDGVMFTDKISADALVELQPLLDDMTAQMERQQQEGQLASNDELLAELRRLQAERTDG
ncbi:MAG: peptide deformylase [Fuerstiella sp.]|nr:peptide deformylase [Fuerstiella sp.]MCP4856561.1 peptide deformylase [Fuerstiella sp.]